MNQRQVLLEAFLTPEVLLCGITVVLLVLGYLFRQRIARRLFALDDMGQKILAQKKSSEVRIGHIVESLSPLLADFPVDVRKDGTSIAYIGKPVDYIHFDPERGITFIEVKSGGAKLSPDQKKLKALIDKGKVAWAEFRVK